jgi:hypothetical protein
MPAPARLSVVSWRNYIYNEIYLCIRYYGTINYESLKRNYVDNI